MKTTFGSRARMEMSIWCQSVIAPSNTSRITFDIGTIRSRIFSRVKSARLTWLIELLKALLTNYSGKLEYRMPVLVILDVEPYSNLESWDSVVRRLKSRLTPKYPEEYSIR